MRSVDERCAAVRGRTRKLRRKREGGVAAVVAALALFSLVDLVGRSASEGLATTAASNEGLFGAASLFGPSMGGYVLVALVAAVIAVLVTVFFMVRRSGQDSKEETAPEPTSESVPSTDEDGERS